MIQTHLFSSGRQTGVPSNPSLDVEVALTMATQIDGTWCNVYVHQIVHDSGLDVAKDTVHQETAAHVHDLYVGDIPETGEASQASPIL